MTIENLDGKPLYAAYEAYDRVGRRMHREEWNNILFPLGFYLTHKKLYELNSPRGRPEEEARTRTLKLSRMSNTALLQLVRFVTNGQLTLCERYFDGFFYEAEDGRYKNENEMVARMLFDDIANILLYSSDLPVRFGFEIKGFELVLNTMRAKATQAENKVRKPGRPGVDLDFYRAALAELIEEEEEPFSNRRRWRYEICSKLIDRYRESRGPTSTKIETVMERLKPDLDVLADERLVFR